MVIDASITRIMGTVVIQQALHILPGLSRMPCIKRLGRQLMHHIRIRITAVQLQLVGIILGQSAVVTALGSILQLFDFITEVIRGEFAGLDSFGKFLHLFCHPLTIRLMPAALMSQTRHYCIIYIVG